MKTTLFLRIASVLAIIHAILHTIGGMLSKPSNGAPEIALQQAHPAIRAEWVFRRT